MSFSVSADVMCAADMISCADVETMLTDVIQINRRANPASFRFARTNCGLVSGIVFARETFGFCRTPLDRKQTRDLVTSNVRGIIEAPDLAGQQHEAMRLKDEESRSLYRIGCDLRKARLAVKECAHETLYSGRDNVGRYRPA